MNSQKFKFRFFLIFIGILLGKNLFAQTQFDSTYKFPNSDGRFTLGVEGKRIMYGYPFPYSTSHFVLNVDGKFASNYSGFLYDFGNFTLKPEKPTGIRKFFQKFNFFQKKVKPQIKSKKGVAYLTDTLKVSFGNEYTLHSQITYLHKNLKITQKLTPVNEFLEEITDPQGRAKYYRVEYLVENTSKKKVKLGLLVLFDLMIHDNDACRVDAFDSEDIDYTKGQSKRLRNRGMQVHFEQKNIPKRLLVYREVNELTKDLTGDFFLNKSGATPPNHLYIGPWPLYHATLWELGEVGEVRARYDDSGVILRWDIKDILPNETLRYAVYYGIFGKGSLELVPAGTPFTGHDSTGRRIVQDFPTFTANKYLITEGDSVQLEWQTQNPLNADVKISCLPTNQPNNGKIWVKPQKTTSYQMSMYINDKKINIIPIEIRVLPKIEKPKPPVYVKPKYDFQNDGRFTLGNKETKKRMLFGYPLAYAGSHFVLNVDKNFASNSPNVCLINKNVKYLSGEAGKIRDSLTIYDEVGFEKFANLQLKQKIVSVNQQFLPVNSGEGEYFRLDYVFINPTNDTIRNVNFSLFLDACAGNKDDCVIKADKTNISLNTSLAGKKIPSEILFSENTEKPVQILTKQNSPDEVIVGHSAYLSNVSDNISLKAKNYVDDSGLFFLWKNRNVAPRDSLTATIFIGTGAGKIDFLYNNLKRKKSMTVYFESSREMASNYNPAVKDFFRGLKPEAILLEGYTDGDGNESQNYQLSKERAESVKKFILSLGFKEEIILVKNYGEFFKNHDKDAEHQRKVVITILGK